MFQQCQYVSFNRGCERSSECNRLVQVADWGGTTDGIKFEEELTKFEDLQLGEGVVLETCAGHGTRRISLPDAIELVHQFLHYFSGNTGSPIHSFPKPPPCLLRSCFARLHPELIGRCCCFPAAHPKNAWVELGKRGAGKRVEQLPDDALEKDDKPVPVLSRAEKRRVVRDRCSPGAQTPA